MSRTIFIIFLALISTLANAEIETDTIIPGRMLSFRDTIEVQVGANQQRFLLHPLRVGQTPYSLSKYYSISITDLKYYNPELTDMSNIEVGHRIRIPISLRIIKRVEDEMTSVKWKVVPVVYTIKPGETLFSVARRYFNIDVEILKARNGMEDNTLEVGQQLLIGWFDVRGIPSEMRRYTGLTGVLGQINSRLKQRYRESSLKGRHIKEKGVAIWSKSDNRGSSLYVLHRTAKPGTVVQLANPMNNIVLYAKVLGPIPPNRYGDEVIVYVPPVIATALGALDRRFVIHLSYYR